MEENNPYLGPNGKFKPGNCGGPGNPNIKRQHMYRDAVQKAVKQKDLVNIFKALVKKALEGDVIAAKIVIERTIGKCPKDINLNTNGLQPIAITFTEVKPE